MTGDPIKPTLPMAKSPCSALCPEVHRALSLAEVAIVRLDAHHQRLEEGDRRLDGMATTLSDIHDLLNQGLREQARREGAAVEREQARERAIAEAQRRQTRRDFWAMGLLTIVAGLLGVWIGG